MSCLLRIICAGLLLGFSSIAGWATTASSEDKPPIPPDLYYEFKLVPAEENAIINWRRAAEVAAPLSDKEKQTIKYCWSPTAREPSPNDLIQLQSWLRRNAEALRLFNASLDKSKAQWPERNPQNVQPELTLLPLMIRARLFEADQLAEQNKFIDAAKSLEDSLKLAQIGTEGDATTLHYLVACNARTLTQDAILRLACRKEVPVAMLQELLKKLPSLDSETNIYNHVFRVEFSNDYNNSLDLKKLTENLTKMSGTNATIFLSFYPDDLQRAFRVLLDPSLVPLHDKPFDAKAEIEKSIRHYRIYLTNSLVPWNKRNGEVELEHEEDHTNLVEDIATLMELVKDDLLPLNRQAVQKARAAYLEIKNPLGRIFDTSIISFVASDLKVCQVRTEREATRAFLALLIFEKQKGQLPPTLSDLVKEKILASVPIDPFSGEPLHYSKEKRKIWSISDDGEDDGGASGDFRWYEKDAVWQIPNLN
ncbi:MAG: hypothetical protein WDN00_15635 [Limisphaerales bacterium]